METGRQLTLADRIVDAKDSKNNIWFLDGNKVYLKLAGEEKNRVLGKVKKDTFFVKRIREKHLLRINNSYGFGINVIEQLNVDFIELYEDSGVFKFPVDVLRQFGDYLHFKQEGFERQMFLQLDIINQYRYTPEMDEVRTQMMGEEWYSKLKPEFDKDYMINLGRFLAERRKIVNVYPPREKIFRSLKCTPYSQVKVVVLMQDSYHTDKVADGLAMSSNLPEYIPPTLNKVFDAIEKDTGKLILDRDPKLDRWAEQGVFLFNTILTVEQGQPKSHAGKGWEQFTGKVLSELKDHPHNLVVFLWGRDAQGFRPLIDNNRHLILEAEHPAAAARNNRKWEHLECFSKANKFLESNGYGTIEW